MFPQSHCATSSLRRLCEDIETQINRVLSNLTSPLPAHVDTPKPADHQRSKFQRMLEQLKSELIQTVTYQLPKIVSVEETLSEQISDLRQERDEWCDKYKRMFKIHEQNQLQNDKMKMEIVALSENYESVSLAFEQLKYKYCEIKQKELEGERLKKNQSASQMSQDGTERDNQRTGNNGREVEMEGNHRMQREVMKEERELFLQQIRQSQKEIIAVKQQNQELTAQGQRLQKQNQELHNLLKGEKVRSDRLDRQILQILNKNEDLKIQKLQQQQKGSRMQQLKEETAKLLQQQKKDREHMRRQKDTVTEELNQNKKTVLNLKLQNSKQREKYCLLEQEERNLKTKINEMKKQNQQMRTEIEKLITQLRQTHETLTHSHRQELTQLRRQYEDHKNRSELTERQLKSKSVHKLQEISKMHKDITDKLQHKIHLLEKDGKQKKERIAQMKFQIQRLYESLQIQVEKQFKSNDKNKEILHKYREVEQKYTSLEEKDKAIEHSRHSMEQQIRELKEQLSGKDKKLTKLRKVYEKLTKLVLPKLKEQIYATRLSCQHFCKMIEMEKEQNAFFLQKRQENFCQLIEQTFLQSTMAAQKSNLNYQNQLQKWKDHCKKYQEKYGQLKELHDSLQHKYHNLESSSKRSIEQKEIIISKVMEQMQEQRKEQMNTSRNVQKLKEKCREVEQYYKLVEDLSKQNFSLKNKLENQSYSFRSPERSDFQQTSKNRKIATEESLQRHSKMLNQKAFRGQYSLNDIANKAELQKIRLESVKKEYNMVNRRDL